MKPFIAFFLFHIFSGILSFSTAQTCSIKVQTLETIKVNLTDTVIEMGSDLLLEIKPSKLWSGANLAATINGIHIEPQKIAPENYLLNIDDITEDLEIVLSMESIQMKGEIVYYNEVYGEGLLLRFPLLQKDMDAYIITLYKKDKGNWILYVQEIVEPVPSGEKKLKNDNSQTKQVNIWWKGSTMPYDTEYYTTLDYFRRYKGEPLVFATVTSPVFKLNDYSSSNLLLNTTSVSSSSGMIHIETAMPSCSIQVYTIAGKLETNMTFNTNKITIPVSAGIYIVIVKDQVFKIVVE